MSTNKNAVIRYQALDRCLRNPYRKYFLNDLLDECNDALFDLDPSSSGISKRQLFDDLKFMKDSNGYNAPIESIREGRTVYYAYSDPEFTINNQPLTEQEAQKISEALLTLSRFKGMPQFEWIEEIKIKFEQQFSLKSARTVIEFEENPFLMGLNHIHLLYNSIVNQQVLKIYYKSFKRDYIIENEIHPYFLKQYNNRWFLFGWNSQIGDISNMPLDRISKIELGNSACVLREVPDMEEYFEDIIGVTLHKDAPTEKILLKVAKQLLPYIETKPIHGSQKVKMRFDDYSVVQLELKANRELLSLILSYGDEIEVLEPEGIRNSIKRIVDNLNALYDADLKSLHNNL